MNCLVLVDATRVARWKRDCIELLRRNHTVEIGRAGAARPSFTSRLAGALIGGAALRPGPVRYSDATAASPQVVLDLRADTPATTAVQGVDTWYFCDGIGRPLGDLPGAWEIASGSPTFEIALRARSHNGCREALLRTGRFKSLYAYSRSMDVALRECTHWPSIALSAGESSQRPIAAHPHRATWGAGRLPIAKLVLRQIGTFVAHAYRHLFLDAHWHVGVVRDSPASFLSREYRPQIEWLRGEHGFFADPFVLPCNGHAVILGESLDAATRTGFISGIAVDAHGRILDCRTVMRSRSHLSYPYVFEHGGEWYLVPESAAERCIALYRALEFPYRWTRVATLIDGIAACDSTIVCHEGRWWLFCTDRSRDSNLNLFLFHAARLTGPWTSHVANPVKTDVRSTRPAGMPFLVDGVLYRPAQDCAESYGAAITFNRVCKLNEREYEEEEVAAAALSGMHTISYAAGIVAVDAKREVFASPRLIAQRLSVLAARALRVKDAC
jgi:hypothetical protein